MFNDFNSAADSDIEWTTSNYGGIVTTAKIEWEFVVAPDLTKVYPGYRIPIQIDMFLYAVAAQGFDDELDSLLLDAGAGPCNGGGNCVAALQGPADSSFLRKVLLRPVDQRLVDEVVNKLDTALSEHLDANEVETLKNAAASQTQTMSSVRHLVMRSTVDALTGALLSKKEMKRLIEMERERTSKAKITKEDLIGVRLYIGPAFMKFNTVREYAHTLTHTRMYLPYFLMLT